MQRGRKASWADQLEPGVEGLPTGMRTRWVGSGACPFPVCSRAPSANWTRLSAASSSDRDHQERSHPPSSTPPRLWPLELDRRKYRTRRGSRGSSDSGGAEELGVTVTVGRIVGAYGGPAFDAVYPNGDQIGYVTVAYGCALSAADVQIFTDELIEVAWFDAPAISTLPRHDWIDRVIGDCLR